MEEEISIEYYETDNGGCPYLEWEEKLTKAIRAQVRKRLNRIRIGNFGDCKPVEEYTSSDFILVPDIASITEK